MKHILISLLLLSGTYAIYAQKNVSTEVENKKALLEEFTGILCGNCPDAHSIVADMMLAQPCNIYAVSIHSGGYAVPGTSDFDFRTECGDEIHDYFNVDYYPSGMINRHVFRDGTAVSSRGNWIEDAKDICSEAAPVNLWIGCEYDGATRKLTISIEGYYTTDTESESNRLSVLLTQDNVPGPQNGANEGDNYMHRHMLRDYVTPTWGEEITDCSAGSFFSKEYTYDVPSDYKGITVEPSQLEVIAFVTAGNEEVLNVTGAKPSLKNVDLPMQAHIEDYKLPIDGTYGFNFVEIYLHNECNDTLTSATFDVSLNGDTETVSWTGSIAPLQSSAIKVPVDWAENITDDNTYSLKLVSINGIGIDGNTIAGDFDAPVTTTPTIKAEIRTDYYADENTYRIYDADGNIVKEFGPYPAGERATYEETAVLESGRTYCFEAADSWGNGILLPRGSVKLYDADGSLLVQQLEINKHGFRTFFRTTGQSSIDNFSIYNSCHYSIAADRQTGCVTITPTPGANGTYTVELFSVTGKLLKRCANVSKLDMSGMAHGAYIVKVASPTTITSTKIIY